MATFIESCLDIVTITETVVPKMNKLRQPGATDYLLIGEQVVATLIRNTVDVSHDVTVGQTTTPDRLKPGTVAISVSQTITARADRHKACTDTLAITEYVQAFINHKDWVDPAIQAYYDSLTKPATISLTCGGLTIHLRKPKFDDKDTFAQSRINRNTRGGDLQVFNDAMWPTTQILKYEFEFLDPTVAAALKSFLAFSLSKLITLVDHHGRSWQGYIITPEAEIVQNKKTTFSARFEFQGGLGT